MPLIALDEAPLSHELKGVVSFKMKADPPPTYGYPIIVEVTYKALENAARRRIEEGGYVNVLESFRSEFEQIANEKFVRDAITRPIRIDSGDYAAVFIRGSRKGS